MKVYDLKGVIVEGKKVVIAVALPKPNKPGDYDMFKSHNISDDKNKIVIHFRSSSKPPLVSIDDNLESFIVELNTKEFDNFDFTKEISVALIHHNADDLPKTPQEIYDEVYKEPIFTEVVGKGTIRP